MRRPVLAFAFVAVVCLFEHAALSQSPNSVLLAPDQQRLVLEEALELYDEGIALRARDEDGAREKFAESAQRFQLLVDAGVRNGPLYYNLANAHLQAGELGQAILNYRRALRYMPGDARVESNLDYARSLVENRIPPTGSRAVVHTLLDAVAVVPWSWRLGGAATLYVLIWVLAAIRLKWRRAVPRSLPWWCALGCVLLSATVVMPQVLQQTARAGVIVAQSVTVRMGNGEGYEPQFAETIHEGVEFSVIERRGEWLEIELPNGGRGWIRAEQAAII